MEAVVLQAKLVDELECGVESFFRYFQWCRAGVPGAFESGAAEYISAGPLEGVPVGDCEAQVVGHGFVRDQLAGVVVLKCQRVSRIRAFVGHGLLDFGEIRHCLGQSFFSSSSSAAITLRVLFFASVVVINLEAFLANRLVNTLCAEEGFLVPEFHPHRRAR